MPYWRVAYKCDIHVGENDRSDGMMIVYTNEETYRAECKPLERLHDFCL
jgi:hypothetical protein